jgi:dienelactone hydrolase
VTEDGLVEAVDVRTDGFSGRLFEGVGERPNDAVLVLHGGGGPGGYERDYARLLAHHGYAALCVSYFDAPAAPDALAEVPMSLFERAGDWLAARPGVRVGEVGVVGFSRGGEAALLVGATLDHAGAVVAYVPSGYGFPAPTWMDGVEEEGPAWVVDGEPFPYVPVDPVVGSDATGVEALEEGDAASNAAVAAASAERLERGTIPVERIDGPVLLVSGGRDRVWPSAELAAVAADRLTAHDHPWPHEHLTYPDAGHAIRVPYTLDGDDPEATHRFGGTVAANSRAAADAWRSALSTLETGLREPRE